MAAHTPPIPLCTGHITYLGIHISSRLSELFILNYTPLLKTISDTLLRWTNLPLSLIGRIASIKMTILPKINYLFSMIPSKPTHSWFKSLDSIINKYYWKNKTPRIKLTPYRNPKHKEDYQLQTFINTSSQINYSTYSNGLTPNIQTVHG